MNINKFFKETLYDLKNLQGEFNNRTGIKVRALPGVTFRTDLENEGFPLLSLRKIPMSFVPEIMWFLSGSDNINPWLTKHTKIWDYFAESDGTVTSAYGKRWKMSNQLDRAIEKLKEDPSSRHAVVITWDIYDDGVLKQKNVPCPYTFTLMIIRGRLHFHNIVRSNDMVLGFPMDVAGFCLLQHMIAQKLGVKVGIYTHSISNAHIYENQMEAVDEMLAREIKNDKVEITLPSRSFERAEALDDALVSELKSSFTNYNPDPPIKNIPIAL